MSETKTFNLVVIYKGELRNPISVTVTRSKAGHCSAEAQVRPLRTGEEWRRGTGRAGGGGYNKETHSAVEALKNAGFAYADIPGGANVETILETLARKMGARGKIIVV